MAKLVVENISFVYGKNTAFEQVAIEGISHSFKEKSVTGIIGHTGSGKSTLIQTLNALLIPSSGRITLDGEDIHQDKRKYKSLRAKIGLVFQYPEYQLFADTVYDDIAFGPRNIGLSESEIKSSVYFGADFANVPEKWFKRSPFDLSGGQKRRVAIAGVLSMRPEVLILDEPVAGLDPEGRNEILDGIRKYADDGATVIIVSHSMEDMAKYADELIVLDNGHLVLSGSVKEVFNHSDELISLGLGIPKTLELMNILKNNGLAVPDGIYSSDKAVEVLKDLLGGNNL